MGRIRRGGYLFITWKGDHDPKHVHIFKDDREILKFDLEQMEPMSGKINRKIIELIKKLVEEGLL